MIYRNESNDIFSQLKIELKDGWRLVGYCTADGLPSMWHPAGDAVLWYGNTYWPATDKIKYLENWHYKRKSKIFSCASWGKCDDLSLIFPFKRGYVR